MKLLVPLVTVIALGGIALARPKLRPEHLEPDRVEPTLAEAAKPTPKTKPATRVATRVVDEPIAETPKSGGTRPSDHVSRGTQLYLLGKFKEAVGAYKLALAINPSYAPAHRALGIAYQRMGVAGLAVSSLRRYLELAPNASDAASIEARIERLGGS